MHLQLKLKEGPRLSPVQCRTTWRKTPSYPATTQYVLDPSVCNFRKKKAMTQCAAMCAVSYLFCMGVKLGISH